MAARRVLARKNEDGHLELLERVVLPDDREFTVTIDVGDDRPAERTGCLDLPSFPGRVLGPLSREEIYEDLR